MPEEFHYSENRDDRFKDTAEFFTPNSLIDKMIIFKDIDWNKPPQNKKFLDPTCGSGNFLVVLAKRNIPLCNIYGVDLMPDNIETTKRRLTEIFLEKGMELGDENTPGTIIYHLERNIICADALTYHYEFWWHKTEQEKEDELFDEFKKKKGSK